MKRSEMLCRLRTRQVALTKGGKNQREKRRRQKGRTIL